MRGHFSRECRAPKNQGNINRDDLRRNAPVDTSTTNSLVVQDGIGSSISSSSDSKVHTCAKDCLKSYEALQKYYYQLREALDKFNLEIIGYQMGLESLEAMIVVHEKNEVVYEENIVFLKYDVQVKDISIKDLKNQLEEALKEKDDLKLKLQKFEESSKNLTKLINSQVSAKDKTGLGYDSHINESEVVHIVFSSRESDVGDSPVNDRFKTGEGFHAVPPPYTGNYMPLRHDLSFAGLDKSIFQSAVRNTTISVPKTKTSISKMSKNIVENPKTIRPSAPIIEEWDTNSDNDSVFRPKSNQTKPKFTKINFVKSGENVKSVNKEFTHRQVEYLMKSQSIRDNRRNWNGMMTQKLRNGFEFIKKACFVCGSFNHLIKDCIFHDNKMVEKSVLNNKGRVTGQREVRPSGQVPVNAAKQSSLKAATSISTAKPVNTVAPKPKGKDALPTTYSYFKAHSPVRRDFNQKSAAKTNNFNEKVNTARVNNVTTAWPKAVVSTAERNRENVVKSSACWIWRPIGNVIDHISKDSGSYMLRRFEYVDLRGKLKSAMAWIIKKLLVDLLHLEEVLKEQYLTHTDYALWEVIMNGDAPVVVESASTGAEAIKNRFGGNKESKKMHKTILKQDYENFTASSQEGLDKTYDRSLPLAWNNIALIMRNKSDLDTLRMDYLYNNLKVYEFEIKGKSSSSSNSLNVAFVSLDNSSSTNETVNTAHSISTASSKDEASTVSYANDFMFSFFANQSNAPQLDYEDLEQIDADDLKEMDLKWQVAMLTMRVKRTKVECYNFHKRGHFARECRALMNQGNRNRDAPRRNALAKEGITNFALMAYTSQSSSSLDCYQMGLESLEARIVVHEKNEAVYKEDIAFLKYDVQVKDISIKDLKN
ncbi:ribonuclease H-like domain-containing protein [Tanacetum coccineum]|uniref:Ribonuclease H-like domain-containing protein n=1 Tax=Tanacetum coccineum TaxID=301880 RepID=A0ABQ5HD71_9ASTR